MADARPFLVLSSSGTPLTGGAAGMTAIARDVTGATRTAPAITEVGEGVYQVQPTDADETAGTVVLIDTGAGNEPRRVVLACHKADRSNQFWAFVVEDTAGALWTGAAPTVGSYRGNDAASRTAPTLLAVAGAYLYVAVPSAADISADVEARFDGPTGSAQAYWYASTEPIVYASATPAASTGMEAEALVARAVREYLLANLPGKVAQLNALRVATLKSALVEPFTVTSQTLTMAASREGSATVVTLPAGIVSAAQVASAINTAAPTNLVASTDAGRVVISSTVAPALDAPSTVSLRPDTSGGPALFGWEAGGEHVVSSALVAPSWRGVVDGWPIGVPDMGRSFWVILGDRNSTPVAPDVRRDEVLVTLDVTVMKPEANMQPHRSREAISSCVRAIRELLTTTDGRYLGRAGAGDVVFSSMTKVTIPGKPFAFQDSRHVMGGVTFDVASFTLTVRVFQRPAS